MRAPFLKKEKNGYCLIFSKSLYPRQALIKLKEVYADQAMTVGEKGRYFELRSRTWAEEDYLKICESFLHFAKNAGRS